MPFDPTLYVQPGRQSPNVLDATGATIAYQLDGDWQTDAGDFIKRDSGVAHGLYERFVDAGYSGTRDHFTSGAIPASHAWVNDVTFSGVPPVLNYNFSNTYLRAGAGAGNRYFLAITGLTTWLTGNYTIRAKPSIVSWVGIRIDDGTDNNFVECGLLAPGANGLCTLRYRERIGGGGIVNTDRTTTILTDAMHTWRLYAYNQGWPPNWRPYAYWIDETPATNTIASGTIMTWAPSRVGITLDATIGGVGAIYTDWLAYTVFA